MIEFQNVTKEYPGGVTAVREVSFTVPTGTICCIIGPSGCGKTTTLRMINRLVEPTRGYLRVNGQPVCDLDVIELRRGIGYVIQQGGLMPHMTVARNITLLEELKGADKTTRLARARELMALVGLAPEKYANRYPGELSGGQQQRVGIARALMSDPPVLLMDEPFGALDPIIRGRLHEEFLALNQQLKKTIVMVTHDLAEAFKMGDQIVLMRRGEIVQAGSKADFLQRPVDDFAREFVSSQMAGYPV
ncbi:MAG: ABC transporter ATP-binding protein [Candidatus Melainabacteria bacterium]